MIDTHERVLAVLKEIGDLMKFAKRNASSDGSINLDVIRMWDIISALRGPDNENLEVKEMTTARIRSAIGIPDNDYITTSAKSLIEPDSLYQHLQTEHHFRSHYRRAYDALKGLGLV